MRTTLDIDTPILQDVKRIQQEQGKSLGRVVSELLGEALGQRAARVRKAPPFQWNATSGRLLVDLVDKEALYQVLDAEGPEQATR